MTFSLEVASGGSRRRGLSFRRAARRGAMALMGAALVILLSLGAAFVQLSDAPPEVLRHYITSDTLYPVHLVIDVFRDRYPLDGWRFAIAPGWFPDLLLVAIGYALTGQPIAATLIAGFVQPPILVLLVTLVARSCGVRSVLTGLVVSTAASGAVLYVAIRPDTTDYPHLDQLLLPQMHTGNTLNCTAGLVMLLTLVDRGRKGVGVSTVMFVLLSALAAASDLLFLPHFLLPASLALAIGRMRGWFQSVRSITGAVLLGWCGAAVGYFVNRAFLQTTSLSAQTELTGSAVGLAASRFTTGYLGKLAELDPLHIAALLWIAILAAVVARIDCHPAPSDVTRPKKLFALTVLLISAVLGPAATIFTGLQVLTEFNLYEAVMRYTQTTFLLPLIGLPVLGASALWQRRPRLAVAVIGSVAALSVAVSLSQIRVPAIPLHRHQPEIVKFVDSIAKTNELGDGYAGYWQARLITLLSTEGVRALPVDSNGNPLLWVANERWFVQSYSDRSRAPGISFVVLDDPAMPVSRSAIVEKLGKPAEDVAGESATVMIYRKSSEPSAQE